MELRRWLATDDEWCLIPPGAVGDATWTTLVEVVRASAGLSKEEDEKGKMAATSVKEVEISDDSLLLFFATSASSLRQE